MREFLGRLLLFLLGPILLGAGWTVFVVYKDLTSYRSALLAPDDTVVAVCGDSQTKDALDPALFPHFFNFSTAATTCDQDILRLGDLLAMNPGRFKYILLDVSPLKIGYTSERPISELNAARVHLLLHIYHLWENRRPFGSVGELYRDVIFTRKYNEFRKSILRGKPWRSSMAGRFDPDKTAGFLNPNFKAKAEADLAEKAARVNGRALSDLDLPVFDILAESVALVRAAGACPVVTTMPLSEPLRKALDPEKKAAFTMAVRETAKRLSVPYLDSLDSDLPLECWHDGNHLNRTGAAVFTPRFLKDFQNMVIESGGAQLDENYTLEWIGVYKSRGVFEEASKGRGLSGLCKAADGTFWTIEERTGRMIQLTLDFDSRGEVVRVREGRKLSALGSNYEGIAVDPLQARLWVSEETENTIQAFDLEHGKLVEVVKVPAMKGAKRNRGLESLAISPSGLEMWTCNENELETDRDLLPGASEMLRLVHFCRASATAPWTPDRQWAYRPERPVSLNRRKQKKLHNGVSSLCVLENGDLLVVERETNKLRPAQGRTRIYHVIFDGATDISNPDGLAAGTLVPVHKHLLYDGLTRHAHYEGLALGPRLEDGSQVLILVSDASDNGEENFLTLRLSTKRH